MSLPNLLEHFLRCLCTTANAAGAATNVDEGDLCDLLHFPGNLNGMHHLPGKIGFCIKEFSDYNVLKCIGVCVTGRVLLCVSVCGVHTGRELAMNHCHHITVFKWVPNKNVTS